METNVGSIDRSVRLRVGGALAVLGLAVLGGVFDFGTGLGALSLVLGGVLVGTGLARRCLLYRLVGADTCQTKA